LSLFRRPAYKDSIGSFQTGFFETVVPGIPRRAASLGMTKA
jgi:hypothetical protein